MSAQDQFSQEMEYTDPRTGKRERLDYEEFTLIVLQTRLNKCLKIKRQGQEVPIGWYRAMLSDATDLANRDGQERLTPPTSGST